MNYTHIATCIVSIIIIYIIFLLYERVQSPFWSLQPIYKKYRLDHLLKIKGGVICKNPIPINKYHDFMHITTLDMNTISKKKLSVIVSLIQGHFLPFSSGALIIYKPSKQSIQSMFLGHNDTCFVSTYELRIPYVDKTDVIARNDLHGVITGRPVKLFLLDKDTSFTIQYVDLLCVHSDFRGKKIAPKLIQTHEYNVRKEKLDMHVSLFKREGILSNALVPLVKYNCSLYLNKFKYTELDLSCKIVRVTKDNFALYIHSVKQLYKTLDVYVTTDYTHMLSLFHKDRFIIYLLMRQNIVIGCFYFRYYDCFYEGKDKIIECLGSIVDQDNRLNKYLLNGFLYVLYLLSTEYPYIYMEALGHNTIFMEHMNIYRHSIVDTTSAYYLYNYIHKSIHSSKILLLL